MWTEKYIHTQGHFQDFPGLYFVLVVSPLLFAWTHVPSAKALLCTAQPVVTQDIWRAEASPVWLLCLQESPGKPSAILVSCCSPHTGLQSLTPHFPCHCICHFKWQLFESSGTLPSTEAKLLVFSPCLVWLNYNCDKARRRRKIALDKYATNSHSSSLRPFSWINPSHRLYVHAPLRALKWFSGSFVQLLVPFRGKALKTPSFHHARSISLTTLSIINS